MKYYDIEIKDKLYISEEEIKGEPYIIEQYLQKEIANQILTMNGNNYENTCDNMRLMADLFELLEENINEKFIVLKYNPMGCWYKKEEEENDID